MYKYLSAINTYNYIDALDGMIKKYNNTVYSAIKMKPKDAVLIRISLKYIMRSMKIINLHIPSINLVQGIK